MTQKPSAKEIDDFVSHAGGGNMQLVKRFLEDYPGFVDAKYNGYTALDVAVAWNHPDFVELLLEKGARLDEVNPKGQTPLKHAKLRGFVEVERLLQKEIQKRKERAKAEAKAAAEQQELLGIVSDPALRRDLPAPKPLKSLKKFPRP